MMSFLSVEKSRTNRPLFYLFGNEGAGKSHLLYACCHQSRYANKQSMYVDMSELKEMPTQVIDGIVDHDLVCIDNLDSIAGNRCWEVAIFDLINQCLEENSRCKIIMAGITAPLSVGFELPDLVSRLNWGGVYQLAAQDDDALLEIVKLRLMQRGLIIHDDTVRFLLTRVERDLSKLMSTIVELDEKSLIAQRKLTIPFIKEALSL